MRHGLHKWSNGTSCVCVMWQEIRSQDRAVTELAHLTQISFLEEVFFPLTLFFFVHVYLQVHQLAP